MWDQGGQLHASHGDVPIEARLLKLGIRLAGWLASAASDMVALLCPVSSGIGRKRARRARSS